MLRLLALFQTQRDWSGGELARRLEVTTRTVRNDIERLRILGYEIRSTTGHAGGYRLGAGANVPPLVLDDDEAVAVAVSLHAAAGGSVTGIEETALRALTKLEHMLPSRLRHRIESLRSATVSLRGRGPTVDAEILTAIASATRDREQLRFDYLDHNGASSRRSAEPHRLVYTGHRWYLLAWDVDRGDWRTFRADRIRPKIPNGPRFTPREMPADEATDRVVRGTSALAWPHRARVQLHAPSEEISERIPSYAGILVPIDENNAILETGADSLRYIALLLCGLDMPFTVLEPPELRNELTALADRLRRAATSEPASQMTHQAMIPEWYHPTMAMTLRLSDDDDALLTSTALAEGRSKQEIARAAIVEYANRRGHLARRDAHIAEIVATDSDLLRRLAE